MHQFIWNLLDNPCVCVRALERERSEKKSMEQDIFSALCSTEKELTREDDPIERKRAGVVTSLLRRLVKSADSSCRCIAAGRLAVYINRAGVLLKVAPPLAKLYCEGNSHTIAASTRKVIYKLQIKFIPARLLLIVSINFLYSFSFFSF